MKNALFTIVAVTGLSTMAMAQQQELTSAAANIEKKNYIAALDDISKAKKKVTELMQDQLASALPATFGEFQMEKDGMESAMGGSGVSLNRTYRKPKAEGGEEPNAMTDPMAMMNEARIEVQISTDMMMAGEVMNAHSMSESSMVGDQNAEAYRVKGYRALYKTSGDRPVPEGMPAEPATEEASAIVGAAYVKVRAVGLEPGKAKAFLEAVDLDKLIGIVGK